MPTCTACAHSVRVGARFCTRCGSPVLEEPVLIEEPVLMEVPSRIPPTVQPSPLPGIGASAVALVAGVAPLVMSVVGNLVAAELARSGQTGAALSVVAAVFIVTAGSLAACGILGIRALRRSVSLSTLGRGLSIAGLTVGGVNLILWISGLVITVGSLRTLSL